MKYLQMFFVKGVSLLSLFGVQVFLARALSVRDFGSFSYHVSIATIATLFIIWGLDRYIIKTITVFYENNLISKIRNFLFGTYSLFIINLVFLLSLFFIFGYFDLFLKIDAEYYLLVVFLVFFSGISKVNSSVNKALGEVLISEISINILRPVVFLSLISIVYFLFDTLQVKDALLLLSLSYLLSFFFSFFINRKKIRGIPQFKKGILIKIYTGSFVFFIVGLGMPLLSNIDILMLGKITTKENLALYVISTKITSLILMGLVSANLLIAPKLPVLHKKSSYNEMQILIRQNNLFILMISVIPIFLIFFFPEVILSIFGKHYIVAKETLKILLIGQIVNVACGPVLLICMMCDLQHKAMSIIFIGCGILAFGCILLIPILGILGAAISNIVAYSFVNIALVFIVYKNLSINPTLFNTFIRNSR